MVLFFVNGSGMRGGPLHEGLGDARFMGEDATEPIFRFLAWKGQFPGLLPNEQGGASIRGELYSVSMAQLHRVFIPSEPAELEVSTIPMTSGKVAFGMRVRRGTESHDGWEDITHFGGWRAYQESLTSH